MVGLRAPWGPEGGVERVVAELAPRLVRRGVEVTVYCRRRYNPLGEIVHEGVQLRNAGTVYTKHLEALVHTSLVAPRAALGHDLVHFHAMGPAMLSWLPRLAGTRSVVTIHGLDHEREKWGPLARAALRSGAWCAATFPDRVMVVGAHLREHFRLHYGVEVLHVPNGVAAIDPVPLEESAVPGLRSRGFFLFVGRLVPEKGLERLIEAFQGSRDPLVVVGSASHSADFEARLRRSAGPSVRFVGPRFGRSRDALLTHARALVQASTIEGLPLAPLEAMSAGTPVLLSDIAPHREILGEPARGGWLVRPDAWRERLDSVAALDLTSLEQTGNTARDHVRSAFSWERAAEATLACYHDALSSL